MDVLVVAAVLAVAAAAVGVLGWTWWRNDGALQRGSLERIEPADVALPEGSFGEVATLLLLTTREDDRTAPVRAELDSLAQRPGVRVAVVDLNARGDLAGRYGVTRTPTVLALDADHRLRARVKGAGSPAVLRAALDAAVPRSV